jgi:hypothetical protein
MEGSGLPFSDGMEGSGLPFSDGMDGIRGGERKRMSFVHARRLFAVAGYTTDVHGRTINVHGRTINVRLLGRYKICPYSDLLRRYLSGLPDVLCVLCNVPTSHEVDCTSWSIV